MRLTKERWAQLLLDQRIRYLLVGGWNTVFGYVVFLLLYSVLTPVNVHYISVLLLSQIIGITNAYIFYKLFVFKTRGNYLREYFKFYLVYGSTFLINILLMMVFVELLLLNPILSQGVITIILVLFSYTAHKHYSFK